MLGFFLLQLQKIRIRAMSQPCNTKFFLLSTGHNTGLRLYYKQRHFEFVTRRIQSDGSKKCDNGMDKCEIFGAKTAEVTSDWEKSHNVGLYVYYYLQCYSGEQIKHNGTDEKMWHVWERRETHSEFWCGSLK